MLHHFRSACNTILVTILATKKNHVKVPKKGTLSARNQKRRPLFLPTSRPCPFHAFSNFGGVLRNAIGEKKGIMWEKFPSGGYFHRSLGALRAPTSSLRPFGPALGPSGLLDFVLRTLRALRPCDPRKGTMIGSCVSHWIVC